MKQQPVIGIIGYRTEPNRGIGLRQTYIDSILRAGGLPVILPLFTDEDTISNVLTHIDGLLLSGGCDVNPARYCEERLPECGEPNDERDASELLFVKQARKMQMPILGICRGVQLLNVAYGGTLIQDIPSQRGIPLEKHDQAEPYTALVHEVTLTKGGLLNRITGETQFMTNSVHHQAIMTLGSSLVCEALSTDGIIEAVSDSADDAVFGVQFHPEYFSGEYAYAQKLFDYFVSMAQTRSES